MTTLFISDLHLDPAFPAITRQFLDFLRGPARDSEALYILGDLFEVWIGDDDDEPHHTIVRDALRAAVDDGLPVHLMHGNRDFLLGERFVDATGVNLLDDPTLIELHGRRILLSHGDRYCTDDVEYQAFRSQARDPAWQRQVLALPLAERRQLARRIKADSNAASAGKSQAIMDVNAAAIDTAFAEHAVSTMIHGHTHRPAVHRRASADGLATRTVLGDWYAQSSILYWRRYEFVLDCQPRPDDEVYDPRD